MLVADPPDVASSDDASHATTRSNGPRRGIGSGARWRQLTPPLRAAVLLRYFEGLSYEEMAETLDCAPGTIASRLSRAHAALATVLATLRTSDAGDA